MNEVAGMFVCITLLSVLVMNDIFRRVNGRTK
jgi:multisubunit Na+/H+ antiporter MnhG subunit